MTAIRGSVMHGSDNSRRDDGSAIDVCERRRLANDRDDLNLGAWRLFGSRSEGLVETATVFVATLSSTFRNSRRERESRHESFEQPHWH